MTHRRIEVTDGAEPPTCREGAHKWKVTEYSFSLRRLVEKCIRCGVVQTKAVDAPPIHTAILSAPENR